MALKVLMLRSRMAALQQTLDELRTTAGGFETREAEIAAAIEEAQTDEERSAVDAEIEAFDAERAANEAEQTRIAGEIAELERQIGELETAAAQARSAAPGAAQRRSEVNMPATAVRNTRALRLLGETPEQRSALVSREDVKDFLSRVRELKGQNRSIKGAELGVPDVLLGILRDATDRYSKLIKYITVRPIKGKSRQNIAGAVPEAIWTEAVASLNELDVVFTQIEVDGYKVGGYLAVPNSDLEDDDDLQLAASIVDYLGQAIGLAVDKAIPYGTGVKMPVGFVTRLAATAQPAWWGANQGDFVDLSASNILKLDIGGKSGTEFFSVLLQALAVAKPNYATGGPVWIMNRKTHMDIVTRALTLNAAGALVAGMQNTMPIIGGDIVELDYMADYDIAGGYLDLCSWAERSGANIASSDIPLFLQDQTVFKGTQRYDGKPVRGEAFVLVNYHNTAPATSKPFGEDLANADIGTLIVTSAAGSAAGTTVLTIAGNATGAKLMYKLSGQPAPLTNGAALDKTWQALPANKTVAATTGEIVTVAEVNANGKAVKVGSASATVAATSEG